MILSGRTCLFLCGCRLFLRRHRVSSSASAATGGRQWPCGCSRGCRLWAYRRISYAGCETARFKRAHGFDSDSSMVRPMLITSRWPSSRVPAEARWRHRLGNREGKRAILVTYIVERRLKLASMCGSISSRFNPTAIFCAHAGYRVACSLRRAERRDLHAS